MMVLNLLFAVLLLQSGQPATSPSIVFDPATAGATGVHWTLMLSAPYCGGFRIGDGVYIQPEAPLALPPTVAADGVLFNGLPSDVSLQGGVLRVAPSPTLVQSMICLQGERPFTVELLNSLGLANPDAGDYLVDVWLGAQGTPQQLPVSIVDATAGACDPIQQKVQAAATSLQADNAALATTFDSIRAQSAQINNPRSAAAQAGLLGELAQVQAKGQQLAATPGWNPIVAYAAPASEWAQGPAQTDIAQLQAAAVGPDGAPQSSLSMLISLVQLAQQEAQAGNTASQQYFDVVQQLGDCGLSLPPAP